MKLVGLLAVMLVAAHVHEPFAHMSRCNWNLLTNNFANAVLGHQGLHLRINLLPPSLTITVCCFVITLILKNNG
jgi:hypothetical protein